jgi:hypothetical protein
VTPPVIAASQAEAEANGSWFDPPRCVADAVVLAELDREFDE